MKRLLLSAACLLASGIALAEMNKVVITPNPARAGDTLTVTVHDDDPNAQFCGFEIEWGDGERRDVKVDNDAGLFPRSESKVFPKPGHYTVKIKGKKVTSHFPCAGYVESPFVVEAAKAAPAKNAGCPEGWKTKSKIKDGSFTCEALSRGAASFTCPEGFAYAEKGLTASCRKKK